MSEFTDKPYIEEVSYGPKRIDGVSTSATAFIDVFKKGPIGKTTSISSIEEFTNTFGGVDDHSEASYGIYQFFLNRGSRALVVRVRGRKSPGKRAIVSGLKILASEKQDSINILYIPAVANLVKRSMRSVYASAIEYCEANRTFFIIDISERVGRPDQMIEWVSKNTSLRSRNAAVYFPRIKIQDPINPTLNREVSPSGTIAGIFARTDYKRGVWKAPAVSKAILEGALDLGYDVTDDEHVALNPQRINCIRKFPDQGILCWGARTLGGHDQWRYISVQRLRLYVEGSIYRGTQWAIFEPNDATLWARPKQQTSGFLQALWRQGAIAGSRQNEAYFVRCDRTTTSKEESDRGIVNILIGVAILRPAEFVLVNVQKRTG